MPTIRNTNVRAMMAIQAQIVTKVKMIFLGNIGLNCKATRWEGTPEPLSLNPQLSALHWYA